MAIQARAYSQAHLQAIGGQLLHSIPSVEWRADGRRRWIWLKGRWAAARNEVSLAFSGSRWLRQGGVEIISFIKFKWVGIEGDAQKMVCFYEWTSVVLVLLLSYEWVRRA